MQSVHDFMLRRRSLLAGSAAGALGMLSGENNFAQTAGVIRVAAASDLSFALADLGARFERETGLKLAITFGSSGNLARQLEQGLPADLFLSADEALIFRLARSRWARDEGVLYGRGRLVWLVPKSSPLEVGPRLTGLLGAMALEGKLSIAHPDHAPYGRAARSALQYAQMWQKLQSRLILGESVSQATQFVVSGAAQAGLVALSLALAPEVAQKTRYGVVDELMHPPIRQRMALSRFASAPAQRFYAFLQTDEAKKILGAHGLG